MADQRIVTEIIVDSRQAEAGLAAVGAASRAAQREFDKSIAKSLENAAALKRVGQAGKDAADVLTLSSAGLNKAAAAADAYRGRLDPLVFAQNALGKELKSVEAAIFAVDVMNQKGRRTDDEAIRQVAELTVRKKELVGVLGQVKAGTMDAAEAMTFMKTASERLNESIKPVVNNVDALRAKLVPLEAAQKAWAASVAEINDALAKNVITLSEAALARERLTKATAVSVRGMTEEEAAMAARDAMLKKLTASQTAYNQVAAKGLPFVNQPTAGNPLYGAARNERQSGLEDTFSGLDKFKATLDPLFPALQKYQKALADIDQAEKMVVGSSRLATAARQQALATYEKEADAIIGVGKKHEETTKKMDGANYSAGQLKFANQQLTVQFSQMISGIASGQPILLTLIQQGHQLFDVAVSSNTGFAVFGSALRAIVSPLGLVVIGVGAVVIALGAMTIAAEKHQRELLDTQERLRATQASYKELGQTVIEVGRQVAGTSTLNKSDATATANAFASNQRFAGSKKDLEELVRITEDAARVMGTTVPEAAKKFADAMNGPSAVVQEFADQGLLGFNQKLADSIDLIQRTQGKGAAFEAMMKQIEKASHGAAEEGLTPLGKAWNDFLNSFSKFGDAAKPFTDVIGGAILGLLTKFVEALTSIVNGLREITALIPNIPAPPQWFLDALKGRIASGLTGGLSDILGSLTGGGGPSGPTQAPANIAAALLASASANNLDPELLIRLQKAEGVFKDGAWQLSSTGAVGPMQVLNSTFAGMQKNPRDFPTVQGLTDNSNPTQNVMAGGAYLGFLIRKYGDVTLGVLAYHEGETKMDAILQGKTQASQEGLDEARKVLAGYKGTGLVAATASTITLPETTLTATKPGGAADINDAQKLANSANAFKIAHDRTLELTHAYDLLKESGQGTAEQLKWLTLAIEASRKAEDDAIGPVAAAVREHDRQTETLHKLGDAYVGGYEALHKATIATQAYSEATSKVAPNTEEHRVATELLTAAITRETQARVDNATAAKNLDTQQQLDYINKETATLNDRVDVRARELAVYKQTQELQKNGANLDSDASKKALALAAAVADANTQLQISTQAIQEVGNLATQAFDQVGQAITQAFTSGQGAAVNFGNVARAVMTSVLQEVVKLAVINPILNAVVGGQNRTTLDQVLFAYGLGGSSSVGGASGVTGAQGASAGSSGLLGQGSSLLSAGSSISKFLPDGFFSNASGGVSGLSSFINTPVTSLFSSANGGAFLGGGQFGPVTSGLPAGGAGLPAGGATLGGAVAGIGAGFALGSLAGSGIQGMRGTTGPAPMIGAATGAIAGAVIGTVVPVIGTVIGAIIGGIIGGSGGGLIGPKKASPFSSTLLTLKDGRAEVGQTLGQGVDTDAERQKALDDVKNLNDYLDATALKLSSLGDIGQIGTNSPKGYQDPSKITDLNAGFSKLRFGSDDPILNKYLQNKSFGDSDALKKAIADYHTLVDTTIPTLMAFGKTTGSVNDALKEMNDSFNAAIAQAKEYGIATDALTRAQADGAARIAATAAKQISDFDTTLSIRKAVAQGGDPQTIELRSFDQGAQQQRDQFRDQMVGLWGDAYKTTAEYARQMALLEDTLGAERATIVKKYADQILQQEKQMRQINDNLSVREMNVSGASAQDKALFSFDVQARQERESFGDSLAGIYGEVYRTTEGYAKEMQRLETVQGAERVAIVKQYADALIEAERGLARGDQALKVRLMNATPGVADLDRRLYAFDINAANEREDFSRNLLNIYGDSYATTAAYASRIALLEQTLGAERLAIVTESNDAIAQKTKDAQANAANAIQSLVTYAQGLQTSDASPLSQQDQYTLARNKFNAVAGAAAAGDYNSIQQLSGFSDTFLNASRNVYGSGEVYASDFQRVLDALNQVAGVAPDTLTASVLATETRTQTAELVSSLADLKAAVDNITTQLRQNATAPARIAA